MDFLLLSKTKLFEGIELNEIASVLQCLNYRIRKYEKNETVLSVGDQTEEIGLILSGSVIVENYDFWGNRSILGVIQQSTVFAEAYALTNKKLLISVKAGEKSEILFLNTKSLITMSNKKCRFHNRLIQNLLTISSNHNLRLSQRILNTSSKTIRGRLISYLSQEAHKNCSSEFIIPMNRQELADYLNVDRSALSKELSKMQNESLLKFSKNKFQLLNIE